MAREKMTAHSVIFHNTHASTNTTGVLQCTTTAQGAPGHVCGTVKPLEL